jgi:hypothetical protein
MAIAVISNENVTNGSTVTIPVGTTMAIAFEHRLSGGAAIGTPTLTGVSMSIGANSSDYFGIYYVNSPVAGTYTLGNVPDRCRFLYLSGTNGVRAGSLASSTSTDPLATTISSSIDDLLLLCGTRVSGTNYFNISSMSVNGAAVTYLENFDRGYKQSSGDSPNIGMVFGGGGYTLYYCVVSVQSLVASDSSTFMTMIV